MMGQAPVAHVMVGSRLWCGMPSRPVVALILAFWLAATGFAVYRDLWPRLFSSGPPPVELELADEASPTFEVRWAVYLGEKKVGRLNTRVEHVDADVTVQLTHRDWNVEAEF